MNPGPSETATSESWTVRRLLVWTTDYLRRKGAESPRLDAEVLLAHVLGWERVALYTHYEEEIGDAGKAQFRALVKSRAEGAPVAYLVGRKEFYSLKFRVSPHVLIPRPDTEFVVVEFLNAFKDVPNARFVDVGTGSGCIAISCVHSHKTATAIAIDLSSDAIGVAQQNAQSNGVEGRMEFRQGSLLEPVTSEGPFDAILSNPPYIRSDVIPQLEPGVRNYEPHLALDGGPDGLVLVRPLIKQAIPLLKTGGQILLEIGSDQEHDVRALLEAEPSLKLYPTIRDLANHPRVLRAKKV
jgi:release factor glutamine methyltransferase